MKKLTKKETKELEETEKEVITEMMEEQYWFVKPRTLKKMIKSEIEWKTDYLSK